MYYVLDKIFYAIYTNNNKMLRAYVNTYKNLFINKVNTCGRTPLIYAVLAKNHYAIRLLLRNGADINYADSDGWTARYWATFIQDKTAQKILSHAAVLCDSEDISGMVLGSIVMNQMRKI